MSLRLALSGMFLLPLRSLEQSPPDFIQMVPPPVFPRPDLLVTGTGILEILGVIALMIPSVHQALTAVG
jgi:uncharacterized membrane protein